MDLGLNKKVVLVTGASTGIGRATAIAFAREGARIALTFRNKEDEARRTADEVRAAGGKPLVVPFALEEPASAAAVVDAVRARWGELNVLVNNAVRWPSGFLLAEEIPLAEFQNVIRANVEGTFALIQAALPLMRASGWGRIVNVSTGLVLDGLPRATAYTTAKAALHGLTRSLAKEVAPQGIFVNVLMSGTVDSGGRPRPAWMLEHMARSAATGRLTSADDVARAAVFLGSQANGHITGEAIRVDGFFVAALRMPDPPRDSAPTR